MARGKQGPDREARIDSGWKFNALDGKNDRVLSPSTFSVFPLWVTSKPIVSPGVVMRYSICGVGCLAQPSRGTHEPIHQIEVVYFCLPKGPRLCCIKHGGRIVTRMLVAVSQVATGT